MSVASATARAAKSATMGRVKATASRMAALGDDAIKAGRLSLGEDALFVSKAAKQATRQTAKASGNAFQLTQIEINREVGAAREGVVFKRLCKAFPSAEGYVILPQPYLRDAHGTILKDMVTEEARRIDFVVLHKKSVVKSFEVTSLTAPKGEQLAKESRIRMEGGNYILNPETRELAYFPKKLATKVWRLE